MRAPHALASSASAPPVGHPPDDELTAAAADGQAACAVWWRRTPALDGQRVGTIGRYRADSAESGTAVLTAACNLLMRRGCTLAVGPMDGSTWHRYRLVTAAGARPPFFLEPDTPLEWVHHFMAAGFAPFAHFYSAITPSLDRLELPSEAEFTSIAFRPLDLNDYEAEMQRIYCLSLECFRENLLFSPIAWEEFASLYGPLKPHLREGFSWVAASAGTPVGLVFALPDLLQARRGDPVDTVVLKTLVTRPELRGQGLGHALVVRCLSAARERGYRHVVFALIREGNPSGRIGARYGRPMRSYTLFARELDRP